MLTKIIQLLQHATSVKALNIAWSVVSHRTISWWIPVDAESETLTVATDIQVMPGSGSVLLASNCHDHTLTGNAKTIYINMQNYDRLQLWFIWCISMYIIYSIPVLGIMIEWWLHDICSCWLSTCPTLVWRDGCARSCKSRKNTKTSHNNFPIGPIIRN